MHIVLVLTSVLLVAGEVFSSAQSDTEHIKIRIKRKHKEKVPDFHSKTLDVNMESKLGQAKVGNGLETSARHRRDEANAKVLLESAETHSAAAAKNADDAKKNALKALSEDQKLEAEIIKPKPGGGSSPQVVDRGSLPHQHSKEEDEENEEEYSEDDGEEDEDDDGDDDVAEETIVDDGVAQIKTTIIEPRPHHVKKVENVTTKAPATFSKPIGPSSNDNSVCKGLLDLKSMTDDFRNSLRSLLDREEQVIQRLEHVEQNIRKQRTVEPSKACVYIEENVGDVRRISKTQSIRNQLTAQNNKSTQTNNLDRIGPSNSDTESRIHVYTSQGVLPSPAFHQANDKNLMQQQPGRQGHQHSNSNVSHILITSIKPSKSTREVSKDENYSSDGDIDLSNIYWLKAEPDSDKQGKEHTNMESNKYQSVINGMRENGHDVLIIPISSKFKTAKEVAKTLLGTMTDRHFVGRFTRDKKRRKRTIRVRRM